MGYVDPATAALMFMAGLVLIGVVGVFLSRR